ncbi:succinate dehydrogenase iron-sulfur subunit [soil metagenome]
MKEDDVLKAHGGGGASSGDDASMAQGEIGGPGGSETTSEGPRGSADPRNLPEPGGSSQVGTTVPLTLRIRRFNPEVADDPWWDEFTVTVEPTDRLLDALHEVKWHHDGTLALRRSCAHGICGSDAMLINGRNALACKVLVREVAPRVTVEPIRGLRVLKDLIVDMEPFFEGYRAVMPYLINDADPGSRERLQSPEDRERFDDTTKCILCAACTTSCPIFWGEGEYIGPAAIVNAHRFIFDSRDDAAEDRLDILSDRAGVFRCRTTFNCTEACPRGIKVTRAIQEVKRAVMFHKL